MIGVDAFVRGACRFEQHPHHIRTHPEPAPNPALGQGRNVIDRFYEASGSDKGSSRSKSVRFRNTAIDVIATLKNPDKSPFSKPAFKGYFWNTLQQPVQHRSRHPELAGCLSDR